MCAHYLFFASVINDNDISSAESAITLSVKNDFFGLLGCSRGNVEESHERHELLATADGRLILSSGRRLPQTGWSQPRLGLFLVSGRSPRREEPPGPWRPPLPSEPWWPSSDPVGRRSRCASDQTNDGSQQPRPCEWIAVHVANHQTHPPLSSTPRNSDTRQLPEKFIHHEQHTSL